MGLKVMSTFATAVTLISQTILPAAAQVRPMPLPERPVTRPTPLPGPITRPTPVRPGNGGYANSVRCDSRNNRRERCNVRTDNRVSLVRRHNGTCTQGRTWGHDWRGIWVTNNCRATFAYGYGNYRPDRDRNDGPNAGLIIGGVAVAAGLVALLASRSRSAPVQTSGTDEMPPVPSSEPPTVFPPGPPAAITADLSGLPTDARPSMQTCLFEASRQIGATGGTRLRLDRLAHIEPGNGGWRFRAETTATYPDGERTIPLFCRATPTKVVQLDFTS